MSLHSEPDHKEQSKKLDRYDTSTVQYLQIQLLLFFLFFSFLFFSPFLEFHALEPLSITTP
jgi:hypothetical protein